VAALLAVVLAAVFAVRTVRTPTPPRSAVADESVEALPLDAGAGAGELSPGDAQAGGGRVLDAWRFSTDTEEPIAFRVAAEFAPTLVVRAPDGTLHEAAADTADAHVAHLSGLRGKGIYTLTVSARAAGAMGRYTVHAIQDPIPLELVPDGMPSPGELGARGRAGRDGRYSDRFAFEARGGQPYLVIEDADSLFAHVVVRTPEGDSMAGVVYERLRTARGGHASVARFTPRYPGRYLVDVVSNAPGGIGHYMLALKTRPAQVTVRYATVRGVLGLVSQLRGSRYVDVFGFDGRAGRAVAFEVRPAGFTLALLGIGGDTLDAGPRVGVILPKDGRYRVEVSSVAPRGTGSYDLVPAIPPEDPPPPDTSEG
jgi:hypothetical protein